MEVVRGDIVKFHADVIVNAADSLLCHDGGLAGAIVHAGICSHHEHL